MVEASDAPRNSLLERSDVFRVTRDTADEDASLNNPDELQVRCQIEPALPSTITVESNTVTVSLP